MTPVQKLGIHLSSLEREGWGLDQCLSWASRMEIRFFEAGTKLPEEWRQASQVRQAADRHRMTFTALEVAAGSDFEAHLQWAVEAGCRQVVAGLDAAAGLDVAGEVTETPYRQLAATAERSGMVISVDLGGDVVRHGEEVARILESIDSPWLQVAIDTGQVLSAGRDPLELAALFEGRIGHFRIRTASRESGAEPLLRSMIDLLMDGDYRGSLSLLEESGRAEALACRVEEIRRTLELTVANRNE